MNVEFTVNINKDNSETYSGNIINGYKEGLGKLEYWTSRVEIGEFKNNLKNGYFVEYFNGEKTFEGYYVNGNKNGIGIEYMSGEKNFEGYYKEGKKNGIGKEYWNKEIFSEGNYLNDKKNGYFKEYFFNGEYRDNKEYDGIERSRDYEDLCVNYSECTDKEKEDFIEGILEDDYYAFSLTEDELEELYTILGTEYIEKEHIEWIIEKFIQSNYDEQSIYGRVVGWAFFGNEVEVCRRTDKLDVTEYSNGKSFLDSRFDQFQQCFEDNLYEKIIFDVKNIYFRKPDIIEFINKFIVSYESKMFESLDSFMKKWLKIVTYISEVSNDKSYIEFIRSYDFPINKYNENDQVLINYCEAIIGNSKEHIGKELFMYFEIIEKKYRFNSKKESILVGWLLLYYKSVEYFSNRFFNKYKDKYEDIVDIDLDEGIKRYVRVATDLDDEFEKIMLICFLMDRRKCSYEYMLIGKYLNKYIKFDILDVYKTVNDMIYNTKENIETQEFEKYIMGIKEENEDEKIAIEDIDLMTGYEFEEFICKLFIKQGYKAELTKKSNDQGIDIIVKRDNKRIGIQTKRYSEKVGNTAIQEVVAGLSFYNLEKGIVVTNSFFTKSAEELANANNILLWNRERLIQKISEIYFLY